MTTEKVTEENGYWGCLQILAGSQNAITVNKQRVRTRTQMIFWMHNDYFTNLIEFLNLIFFNGRSRRKVSKIKVYIPENGNNCLIRKYMLKGNSIVIQIILIP